MSEYPLKIGVCRNSKNNHNNIKIYIAGPSCTVIVLKLACQDHLEAA